MYLTRILLCLLLLFVCSATGRRPRKSNEMTNAPPESKRRPENAPSQPRRAMPMPPVKRRSRRSVACGTPSMLPAAQKVESVEQHNYWRATENATDMNKLVWDEELAAKAQEWIDKCLWEHGMTKDCNNKSIGQNLYMTWGSSGFPALNVTDAIWSWQIEKNDWNFATRECNEGAICGHWTQNVWAETTHVGCAWTQCPTVTETEKPELIWHNVTYYACDYSPPGNVMHKVDGVSVLKPIYTAGSPTTKCTDCWKTSRSLPFNKKYKCEDDLCVSCDTCTTASCGESCQCGPAATCQHGTWSADDCTCHCEANWFGQTCEKECVDSSSSCDSWQKSGYCSTNSEYHNYLITTCPKACNVCY